MSARSWSAAALAATMMVLGSGCIITTTPSGTEFYRNCSPGTACLGGATCQSANTMPAGAGTPGSFCTGGCASSANCPTDVLTGLPGVCVVSTSGPGQCYLACDASGGGASCPGGQTCVAAPGMMPYCAPNGGGAPACGGAGQACCAGNTCTGAGLACTGGVCSAAPACGNVGQPCCAGNTCTAPGSACASNGTCLLAPYSACSTGSIGSPCASGLSQSGAVIATTCQQAMSMGSTNAFCTATCTAAMTECPQVPSGERGYNCYRIAGAATGQCFQDCNLGMPCPPGTTCRSVMPVGVAGTVQICMP